MDATDKDWWPPGTDVYGLNEVPMQRDIFLLGENQLLELRDHWARYLAEPDGTQPPHPNEFINYRMCAVETRTDESCELNVCIDQSTRYHPAIQRLPRRDFVTCAHFRRYQKRPYLVVSQDWFDDIERLLLSLYALIDVIGMRGLLERQGRVEASQVAALRAGIDQLAAQYPSYAFLTFADNVLLKTNWSAARGQYKDSYRPEEFLRAVRQVVGVFRATLGLDAYAIVTQGANQLVDGSLLQISEGRNHVFLGCLGTPFVELFDIDEAARSAIRAGVHRARSLYMAHSFAVTVNFRGYDQKDSLLQTGVPFKSKMTVDDHARYYPADLDAFLDDSVRVGDP